MTRSRATMARELGLSKSTINRRLRDGVSLFKPKPGARHEPRAARGEHWRWKRVAAVLDAWARRYYGVDAAQRRGAA